jgi:DNA-binding NarL/FixJ family response regulator
MINVAIVDDDPFIRESLKILLELDPEIRVVGTCDDGQTAIEFVRKVKNIDLLLMDIRMPNCDGVACTRQIKSMYPEIKILVLTTFDDDEYIIEAIKYGANGYILKNIPHQRIIDNIKAVTKGDIVVNPHVARKLVSRLPAKSDRKKTYAELGISEIEFQIIEYIAKGMSNKEISKVMFLSEGTVKNHISKILDKLNLRDRTQIAIYHLKKTE